MLKRFIKSNFPGLINLISRAYNDLYHLRFYGRDRAGVFSKIYKTNHWSNEESVSGPGSTLQNTISVREGLVQVMMTYKVTTLLDVPCGDFNWMKEVDFSNIKYLGMDIVPELIDRNNSNFRNENRSFQVVDLVTETVPKVDLIFCRDCLVHLSYKDAKSAIANMKQSGSTYLLTTTFTEHSNREIVTGNWRPINLEQSPFSFPAPILLLSEKFHDSNGLNKDKSLGLWKISDLPS